VPAAPALLEIVVAANGGVVEGQVVDTNEKPAGDITVQITPGERRLRGRSEIDQSATTDQNGHFKIRGIRPGEYKIFAWDGTEGGYPLADAELMRPYEDKGQPLRVERGGRYSVLLHPIAVEDLE
jgi:hypothetical protein